MMSSTQIAGDRTEPSMSPGFSFEPAPGARSSTKPPRVLIADDQWNVCEALRLLLKGEGYNLTIVSGPDELLEELKTGEFDLVLLDLNYTRDTTSGREGLDLLAGIRRIDADLPVLVMTAWSNVDIAIEALRLGACDFIQKPWDNAHVLESIRTRVQQHQAATKRSRNWQQQVGEAVQIQRRLLPERMPQPDGCRIAGAYLPAGSLGGDFFDVAEVRQHINLCVADVSGKGLPAALLMSNLQAALKPQLEQAASPAMICRYLNRVLNQATGAEKFISFFYGQLSASTRELTYCNAGHLPPILVHADGSFERLVDGGAVLGYFEDWDYSEHRVTLTPGSRLLLFTDGIVDACNAALEEFGEDRLIEAAVTHRGLDAEELKQHILDSVLGHCNGRLQDDATLVVIEVQEVPAG